MSTDYWSTNAFEAQLRRRVTLALEKVGKEIVLKAQANAPKSAGAGHASGRHASEFISHKVTQESDAVVLRVGASSFGFYLGFHERGTSKMAARPWLWPAIYDTDILGAK